MFQEDYNIHEVLLIHQQKENLFKMIIYLEELLKLLHQNLRYFGLCSLKTRI